MKYSAHRKKESKNTFEVGEAPTPICRKRWIERKYKRIRYISNYTLSRSTPYPKASIAPERTASISKERGAWHTFTRTYSVGVPFKHIESYTVWPLYIQTYTYKYINVGKGKKPHTRMYIYAFWCCFHCLFRRMKTEQAHPGAEVRSTSTQTPFWLVLYCKLKEKQRASTICIHSDFGQQQRTTVADERELRRKLAILPLEGLRNTETDVLSRKNLNSAFRVQQSNDSLNSAIHTAYRSSLRPSSLYEPRHPSLKV